MRGLRAKLYAKQRHAQKIQMRKAIKQHEERNVKGAPAEKEPSDPIPAYLLDRANPTTAKALSSQIKNKRAEKAARFSVPIPKVRGISEEELFKVYVFGLDQVERRKGLTWEQCQNGEKDTPEGYAVAHILVTFVEVDADLDTQGGSESLPRLA